jgi:hypothetical protein
MDAVLPPTFDWVPPKWRGLAVAVREFCAGMPLVRIDSAFVNCQHVIRLEHLARQTALKRALQSERRARAHVWLERINWRSGAPTELFDALARLLRDATDLGFYGKNWPMEHGLATIEDELNRVGLRLVRAPWRVEKFAGADLSVPDDAVGLALELRRLDVRLSAFDDPVQLLQWTEHLIEAVARHAMDKLGLRPRDDEPLADMVERVQQVFVEMELPSALSGLTGGGADYAKALSTLRAEIEDGPVDGDWIQARHARFAVDVALGWARYVFLSVVETEKIKPAAPKVVELPRPRKAPRTERFATL